MKNQHGPNNFLRRYVRIFYHMEGAVMKKPNGFVIVIIIFLIYIILSSIGDNLYNHNVRTCSSTRAYYNYGSAYGTVLPNYGN